MTPVLDTFSSYFLSFLRDQVVILTAGFVLRTKPGVCRDECDAPASSPASLRQLALLASARLLLDQEVDWLSFSTSSCTLKDKIDHGFLRERQLSKSPSALGFLSLTPVLSGSTHSFRDRIKLGLLAFQVHHPPRLRFPSVSALLTYPKSFQKLMGTG